MYKTIPSCTSNGAPGTRAIPAACRTSARSPARTCRIPGSRATTPPSTRTVRDTKQTAFFASADFDIIPKVLTFTAGTRHFRFENSIRAASLSSFGCFEAGVPAGRLPRSAALQLQPQRRRICTTPNPASRAAAISPGTSRRTRWCITRSRRAFAPAASTRTAAPRTPRAGRRGAVPDSQRPTHRTS